MNLYANYQNLYDLPKPTITKFNWGGLVRRHTSPQFLKCIWKKKFGRKNSYELRAMREGYYFPENSEMGSWCNISPASPQLNLVIVSFG